MLKAAGAFGGALLGSAVPAWAKLLPPTPGQTPGPFYTEFPPQSLHNGLVCKPGAIKPAKGQILFISGRLLGPAGRPIQGARIEIWHANAFGRYHHPYGAGGAGAVDPNFQGFGHHRTAKDGGYEFRTIKPPAYSGDEWVRAPRIHLLVAPRAAAPVRRRCISPANR